MCKNQFNIAYRTARKIVIAIAGVTIILFGVVLIVTPGPAIIVIPLGLAVLGLEFAWARRWLARLQIHAASVMAKITKANS
jgi:tellurite resistance protein TerC